MEPRLDRRLGVFAKHWTPGRAKTRLAATVGDAAAAAAAERFVGVTLDRLSAAPCDRLLAYTPADERTAFAGLEGVAAGLWRLEPQPGDASLGDRMAWFFRRAFADGAKTAVLVGSDSPDLPLRAVERAFEWLSSGEGPKDRLVFGPTTDGGYWLIGARGELGPVFDGMPWSRPELMSETIRTLEAAGWRRGREFELVDQWYDVDTADDLTALCDRIESSPAAEAPLTRLAEQGRTWLDASADES